MVLIYDVGRFYQRAYVLAIQSITGLHNKDHVTFIPSCSSWKIYQSPLYIAAISEYIAEEGFMVANTVYCDYLSKDISKTFFYHRKSTFVAWCKAAWYENPIVAVWQVTATVTRSLHSNFNVFSIINLLCEYTATMIIVCQGMNKFVWG